MQEKATNKAGDSDMGKVKIIALVILCTLAAAMLTACGIAKIQMPGTQTTSPQTTSPQTTTAQTAATETEATAPGILLQITEDKAGYSIAGEPLPTQNQSREFTLAKGDKIYEGLTAAGDENQCVLTITDNTADAVTVVTMEDRKPVSKEIKYNTEYKYTAYTNPDEYSYVFTIKFVK